MLSGFKLFCLVALLVAFSVLPLPAVNVVVREYRGKQVACAYSGLIGVATKCGTEGYARVFTGIVRSAVEKGDTDKLLQVVPDEVFVGDSSDAVAITNQACLDSDIKAGDRWLFYLYRDPKSDDLILSYAGPSKPLSEADDDISMLRDLAHLTNSGILVGRIDQRDSEEKTIPLADHKVIAKNAATGTEYTAYTSHSGHFKFVLPVGTYDVTTASEYGLHEVESFLSMRGEVPVRKGECWSHSFEVSTKAQTKGIISGHIWYPGNRPITVHPRAQIVSVDGDMFTSADVDDNGHFTVKEVKPGRYLVGVGILPGTGFSDVQIPVYYPGVGTKEQATVIELRSGENRTDINFQLPIEDILKPLGSSKSSPQP